MPRPSILAAAAALLAFGMSMRARCEAQEAPFGLTWGPVADITRPYKVDREANLTALYYPNGWGPARGSATAQVVLVICREEGLQQVVWIGVPLAGDALTSARRTIREEGVRRYGDPAPGRVADSEIWFEGRALLASRRRTGGWSELIMTVHGAGFPACSLTHLSETGHPVDAHVTDLIGGSGP